MNTIDTKVSKKEARKLIYEKLATALVEYKDGIKEKKFVTNLKKASKLFAADIAKTIGRKKEKSKKELKKKMKPVAQEKKSNEAS